MRFFPSERFPLLRNSKELAFFLVTEGIFLHFFSFVHAVPSAAEIHAVVHLPGFPQTAGNCRECEGNRKNPAGMLKMKCQGWFLG